MIKIKNVVKSYGDSNILDGVSLDIDPGDFVVILGPSGCGKTTLLKSINKMHPIEKGDIIVDGLSISKWDKVALRKSIGYVIQQVGLLPHLTVRENIEFTLKLQGLGKTEKNKVSSELISLMGMNEEILDRRPRELSGGQKQRVGVARALAADAEIILMDEPFGAVDEIVRRNLQSEIKRLHKDLGKTIVFVTHDIEEALFLGTKIVFMDKGRIIQVSSKEELVFYPKTETVKNFIGRKGIKSLLSEEELDGIYESKKKELV